MIRTLLIVLLSAPAACAAAQEAPPVQSSQTAAPAPAPSPAYTLDTPIQQLAADPAAQAVLDRDLPGLTTHDRYDQFKGLSLKALQPFSGGLITDSRLAAVEAGLRALNASGD